MAFRPDILAGRAVIVVSIQDKLNQELRTIRATLRRFSNSISQIGGDLFRFGAIGTIGALLPIRAFMDFQDQLFFMQTKLRATDEEMKVMEERVLELGRTTSFTSQEVANAGVKFAQAGFTMKESLNALQPALDLARAGQVNLTTATTILVNSLRTFGRPASEAQEFASKFITTARLGTLDIVDMSEAIKESSTTFRQLGTNLTGALALIAQASLSSIKGTRAGTSLNRAFLKLVDSAEKLKKIGVVLTSEDFEKPVQIFAKLEKAIQHLGRQEVVDTLQDIFKIRGARVAGAILIQGLDNLRRNVDEITKSMNEARQAAEDLDRGLGGAFRKARSALQNLNIAIGRTGEGPITNFLNTARRVFVIFEKLSTVNPRFFQILLIIPPAALAVGAALLGLSSIAATFATILTPFIIGTGLLFTGLVKLIIANKGLLKVFTTFKGMGRLVFSGSGVLLLVEALIVFGDKLPVIGSGLAMVGRAFTGLVGNLGLLGSAIKPALGIILDGFNDQNTERGFRRMQKGLELLIETVKTGLTIAWRDFWSELEPITSRISAVFKGMTGVLGETGGAIGKILDSIANFFLGGEGTKFENTISDLFSASNIKSFLIGIQNMIRELGNLGAAIIDYLGEVVDELVKLMTQLDERGLLPQIFNPTGTRDAMNKRMEALGPGPGKQFSQMPIFGLSGVPTEMGMLAEKAKKLRQELKDNSDVWDAGANAIERARKLYEKYFKLRGQEIPSGIANQLNNIAAPIAASIIGSFEGTRGQKLQLLDTKEDEMIRQLEIIADNTGEDDSF